jgi:protein-tyrosine phosphatase
MFRGFGKAYYWINRYLRRGLPVVVHGDLGRSRSAMLVMAYMVRSHLELTRSSDVKGEMRLALSTMLARRKIVAPRAEFMAQLEIYTHIYKPYDSRAILTSSLERVLIGALSNPSDPDLLAKSQEWRDELRKL